MSSTASRQRQDYDFLIKLLLIGDSGMCTRVESGGLRHPSAAQG